MPKALVLKLALEWPHSINMLSLLEASEFDTDHINDICLMSVVTHEDSRSDRRK